MYVWLCSVNRARSWSARPSRFWIVRCLVGVELALFGRRRAVILLLVLVLLVPQSAVVVHKGFCAERVRYVLASSAPAARTVVIEWIHDLQLTEKQRTTKSEKPKSIYTHTLTKGLEISICRAFRDTNFPDFVSQFVIVVRHQKKRRAHCNVVYQCLYENNVHSN